MVRRYPRQACRSRVEGEVSKDLKPARYDHA
jgi:hypothetical protein